jgi:hypothetical protein
VVLSGNRHSILQESLPASITVKGLKDTPFPQLLAYDTGPISNTDLKKVASGGSG